jgi:rhamnosyltransferase
MISCSIIIPTLNARNHLPALVASLRTQSVGLQEIIVIDSSSEDDTAAEASRLGCRLVSIPRAAFSHGSTRNQAAALGTGDVFVFMTQDALPVSDNFLEELLNPIASGDASATYARQIAYPSARPSEGFARAFNYPSKSEIRTKKSIPTQGIRTFFFSNVASAIRRDVFFEVGMFPDKVIMNEDMLFCSTLIESGRTVMYAAKAEVFHSHNYSIAQTFQRYFDIGAFYAKNMKTNYELNTRSTGANYTKNLLFFLLQNKYFNEIPCFIMETCAKFLGFYSGRMEDYIPITLKKKLSLHKFYWN